MWIGLIRTLDEPRSIVSGRVGPAAALPLPLGGGLGGRPGRPCPAQVSSEPRIYSAGEARKPDVERGVRLGGGSPLHRVTGHQGIHPIVPIGRVIG